MVIIDSDGQHNPADIPRLLEPLEKGIDMVIGSRFLESKSEHIPAYRKVGMKVLDTATNFVGGINVTDSQSGFRAYNKTAIQKIRINSSAIKGNPQRRLVTTRSMVRSRSNRGL